ncbi:hypothetical protein Hypma_010171 [Hypsizygus marmoreus]|uniref:Uncharacterized protein n=1 Tax=Hypsizygus marmoreus TaxID=39966 RepID=A0A369JKZ0_HYPMA|nr:hypothetical protein Hypma_010171 [Hypsizygus marmoreus]
MTYDVMPSLYVSFTWRRILRLLPYSRYLTIMCLLHLAPYSSSYFLFPLSNYREFHLRASNINSVIKQSNRSSGVVGVSIFHCHYPKCATPFHFNVLFATKDIATNTLIRHLNL